MSRAYILAVLAVFGFPLVAPLCALGTFEVSRRIGAGEEASVGAVLSRLRREQGRQLPWLSMLMVVALLFWFFLGHMVFALFLGLKPMVNVTTSLDVFLSVDGLMMMGLGTVIGGLFALLFFAICVLGLPLLLARGVDYMTAILASASHVRAHPLPMLGWAVVIVVLLFLAMLPGLLGLLVVLPWLDMRHGTSMRRWRRVPVKAVPRAPSQPAPHANLSYRDGPAQAQRHAHG